MASYSRRKKRRQLLFRNRNKWGSVQTEPHLFLFVYGLAAKALCRSKGPYRSSSVQPFWVQRSRRVATRSALVLLSTTILSI